MNAIIMDGIYCTTPTKTLQPFKKAKAQVKNHIEHGTVSKKDLNAFNSILF